VASSVGFVFNSGDRERMVVRDRECLSSNGVVEVNKKCTVMLSTYL
jgi:mRNA degradation ribonuclease J1/J2